MNKIMIIMMAAALSLSAQGVWDEKLSSLFYFCGYADALQEAPINLELKRNALSRGFLGTYTNYRNGWDDARARNQSKITNILDYTKTAEGRQFREVFTSELLPYLWSKGDPMALTVAARHSRLCRDIGLTNVKPLVEEMVGY